MVGCGLHGKKHGLGRYLVQVHTDEQMNCGSLAVLRGKGLRIEPPDLGPVSDCVSAARQKGRSFFFSVEGWGIDSYIATGLVGDAQGGLQRFWYDSSPCGGGGCRESFAVWTCPTVAPDERVNPNMYCPRREKRESGRTSG
jgi:hypothetical protein